MKKILKFIKLLPSNFREIFYLIYLLFKLLSLMKVFFNPNHVRKPQSNEMTFVPTITNDGVVHVPYTDDDLSSKLNGLRALDEDPAFLASKGVEPRSFGGSVISPLDAIDNAIDSFKSAYSVVQSQNSSSSSSSVSASNDASTSDSVITDN